MLFLSEFHGFRTNTQSQTHEPLDNQSFMQSHFSNNIPVPPSERPRLPSILHLLQLLDFADLAPEGVLFRLTLQIAAPLSSHAVACCFLTTVRTDYPWPCFPGYGYGARRKDESVEEIDHSPHHGLAYDHSGVNVFNAQYLPDIGEKQGARYGQDHPAQYVQQILDHKKTPLVTLENVKGDVFLEWTFRNF